MLNQFSTELTINDLVTVSEARWCKYRTSHGDFLDAVSGLYNSPLGFANKNISDAIAQTSKRTFSHNFPLHTGKAFSCEEQVKLSDILLSKIPYLDTIYYTNSGSEAVDSVIRMVRTPKRKKIITFDYSYHGSTFLGTYCSGNMNLTDKNFLRFKFYTKDDPRSKQEYLKDFEEFLFKHNPSTIAGMVIEPMIGSAGGMFMKENVLPEILERLKTFGIISVLDEVISGFWRLGTEFAFQLYGIQPDVVILSKALTNGMWPLAVVVARSSSIANIPNFGYTMAGHPIGCAAAIAAITQLDSIGKDVVDLGNLFEHSLSEKLPGVKIDREGLFFGLHLYDTNQKRFPKSMNIGAMCAKEIFSNGVICRGNPRSVIIAPAFVINELHFGMVPIINKVSEGIKTVLTSLENKT